MASIAKNPPTMRSPPVNASAARRKTRDLQSAWATVPPQMIERLPNRRWDRLLPGNSRDAEARASTLQSAPFARIVRTHSIRAMDVKSSAEQLQEGV